MVECIEKAKRARNIEIPLIFHCDRGCQYVSETFQKATTGMINSYSKKAYPWDNACIESFHALLGKTIVTIVPSLTLLETESVIFIFLHNFELK